MLILKNENRNYYRIHTHFIYRLMNFTLIWLSWNSGITLDPWGSANEIGIALNNISESIWTLDVAALAALGAYKEFSKLSSIHVIDGLLRVKEMIQVLKVGHEKFIKTGCEILKVTQTLDDNHRYLLSQTECESMKSIAEFESFKKVDWEFQYHNFLR